MDLRDWYRRRTHDLADFTVDELVEHKRTSGVSISVVVPARNEADTVARVVTAALELAEHLVDEIVVIDGGSDDGTAEVAAAAGARVHHDSNLLAEHGPAIGKGDALWRSLSVTSGDIVVFVDADIRNPRPAFVWGLLGPLLADPEVQLVKAFYERPVAVGGMLYPTGGGRVTELCARPLLNLFWPELAGLVQPLSGEYAARRDLLVNLPFFTGYGVEFGMLVDTLGRCGPEAIAQVDLRERVHRNQPMDALSRMAYGILQVAMLRLGAIDGVSLPTNLHEEYVQFHRGEQGGRQVAVVPGRVPVLERPPLRTIQGRA